MQSAERLTLVSRSPVGLAQTLPFIHYLLSYLLRTLLFEQSGRAECARASLHRSVPLLGELPLTSKAAPRVGTGPELLGDLSVPPRPAATPVFLAALQRSSQSGTLGSWPLLEKKQGKKPVKNLETL